MTPHPSRLAKRPFKIHPTCATPSSLYPSTDPPALPHSSSHSLIFLFPHTRSTPLHMYRILSEPHKSAPRHQDMEPPISKPSTSPSFIPKVSVPLCLIMFTTCQGYGAQSPFSQQVAAPAPPCLESSLSLEDCLVASPQDLIAHPTFLSDCVLQPHGGHRATFSALVSSSQAFSFTHTKTFATHNRRD